MKIFNKIITVLMVILSALCVCILICGNNPSISKKIGEVLFQNEETAEESGENPTIVTKPDTQKDTEIKTEPATDVLKETEPDTGAENTVSVWEETSGEADNTARNEEKSVKYPYYEMLDKKEKELYNQLYEEAVSLETTVRPRVTVDKKQLQNAFFAVYNDHPELFWLDASYSYEYMSDGTVVSVDLIISRASGDFEELKKNFEEKAENIAAGARNLATDFEKEKYVHDYLIDNIIYDETHYINQNAYSALIDGRTVCAGYARAFQYIMQKLDIPCYYVVGIADEDHAWNMVELDGEFYNVDVTWDDTEYGRYDYFNKTDAQFETDHTRTGLSVYLPECNGTVYAGVAVDNLGLNVYSDMESYYNACYDAIVENGIGEYEFSCILQGEDLFNVCRQAYDTQSYREAYMYDAMEAVGSENCGIQLEVMQLSNERYRITHKITMK